MRVAAPRLLRSGGAELPRARTHTIDCNLPAVPLSLCIWICEMYCDENRVDGGTRTRLFGCPASPARPGGVPVRRSVVCATGTALCRCERRSNGERKLCWHTIDKNKAATLGNTSLTLSDWPAPSGVDCALWTGVWCAVCGEGGALLRSTPQPQPPPMPAPADACAVALCHRRHTQTLAANVARLVTMRLARPLLHQNRPVCRRQHAMGNGQR